mgnify:CR=1 FL=1
MAMSPEMGPSFTTHLSDEEAFWPDRDLILPMALEVQKLILEVVQVQTQDVKAHILTKSTKFKWR